LYVGFILVGVVIWICRSWEDKRKRDARQEWAQSRGLRYFRSDERLAATTSQVFSLGPLFPYVKRYVARDVVALRTPFGEALYYELTWRSESGENSSYTYSNAIFRYPLPGALPRIRIKGRGMNVIFSPFEELVYGGGRSREFAIATEWQAFNEAILNGEVSADTLDRPDCYDPEIVYFADNLAQYGEALEFSLRDPASGVAFSTRFNSRDFPCATRWILNNPDQQVAAFVLPATARPEGYRAAAAAGTLQWLKAGEHKHFHVNTGIQE